MSLRPRAGSHTSKCQNKPLRSLVMFECSSWTRYNLITNCSTYCEVHVESQSTEELAPFWSQQPVRNQPASQPGISKPARTLEGRIYFEDSHALPGRRADDAARPLCARRHGHRHAALHLTVMPSAFLMPAHSQPWVLSPRVLSHAGFHAHAASHRDANLDHVELVCHSSSRVAP